ncbi:MAG: hypothetical protein ACRAUW_11780, partial [Aeromonas sp.]|uniref:hypothetical protein n=1 Tax=Aeromonas sp. TaxID=647 RepID=UPI003D6C20C1
MSILDDNKIEYLVNMTITNENIDDIPHTICSLKHNHSSLLDLSISLAKPNGRAAPDLVNKNT